jgi:hypothetical protein
MTGCTLDLQHVMTRLGTLTPFEPLGVALLRQGHTDGAALREATIEIVTYTDRCAAIRQQLADLSAVPLPIDLPGFGL